VNFIRKNKGTQCHNVNEFGFLPGPCAIYVDFFHRQRNRREFYQENMELNAIQFGTRFL